MQNTTVAARQDWIQQTRFDEVSNLQALQKVAEQVQARAKPAVVIFDLDSTLYDVAPRTAAIIGDWLQTSEARENRILLEKLSKLSLSQIGYSMRDTFKAIGVQPESPLFERAFQMLKRFWQQRFFSNDYLNRDRAYYGATKYVQEIHRHGADVVYLTGRDRPNMYDGTVSNLMRDEFPWEVERTHLFLKKAAHVDDAHHKIDAAKNISTLGDVVASFENEPKNLIALQKVFPKALHVFVETISSDHPAEPGEGILRVTAFDY